MNYTMHTKAHAVRNFQLRNGRPPRIAKGMFNPTPRHLLGGVAHTEWLRERAQANAWNGSRSIKGRVL